MSNADEILKLKELLDENIITEEEFEKKKNELLNSKISKLNVAQLPYENANTPNIKKSSPHGCLLAFIVIIILPVFIAIIGCLAAPTPSNMNKNLLINQYNLSEEEAQNVLDIINKCGYSDYYSNYELEKSGDNEEIPNSIGFTIKNGQQIVGFIDIKDNKVANIQYSDKILYENGGIQHTLSEYIITSDEKVDLVYNTQDIIKKILKSPSTAKFPWVDEWSVLKKDSSTIVQSYVDAQNSFGATTRSNFQVTYTNGTVTSFIFDGVEYIK